MEKPNVLIFNFLEKKQSFPSDVSKMLPYPAHQILSSLSLFLLFFLFSILPLLLFLAYISIYFFAIYAQGSPSKSALNADH